MQTHLSVSILNVLVFIMAAFIILSSLCEHFIHSPVLMRAPVCNSLIRDVPAALLEGEGGYRMGLGMCDVTLTTPDRAKWMLKLDKVAIFDCDVNIQIYDSLNIHEGGKHLVSNVLVSLRCIVLTSCYPI
jgi:hypothetical protein